MPSVKIKVAKQYFLNNADLLLPSIKDSAEVLLSEGVDAWLNQYFELTPKEHVENKISRWGYDAGELNIVLRDKMNVISGIHSETIIEYGSFLKIGKRGFDFSIFDEEYYITKLRNSFIGDPGRYNGEEKLINLNKKVLKPDGTTYIKINEWEEKLAALGGIPGKNIECTKKQYTVTGEIQFGNWAVFRHDFLRLLNSELDGEIDFYIYITATGTLKSSLSKGIVSFEDAIRELVENKRLIRTPIWVIGLDIDNT